MLACDLSQELTMKTDPEKPRVETRVGPKHLDKGSMVRKVNDEGSRASEGNGSREIGPGGRNMG